MMKNSLQRLIISIGKLESYLSYNPFMSYISVSRYIVEEIIKETKYAQYSLMDTELINKANDIIKVMANSNESLGLVIKDISIIDKSDLIKAIVRYLMTENIDEKDKVLNECN